MINRHKVRGNEMFTVKEVADMLKVHPQTVYRWIYAGKLKAVKIDGIVRIPEKAYDELVGVK